MNTGTRLDPVALGHEAIDIKSLIINAGYVMPQGSAAKLPRLPGEVEAQIAAIEESREAYTTLAETKAFTCPHCHEANYGQWRVEVATGDEFLACGNCHVVVEVR